MANQIFDRDERDPSREPDQLPKGTYIIGTADARALWGVRVLDAYATSHPVDPCVCRSCGNFAHAGDIAARLAAAEAVYPTLPADVRAKLGVRP